MVYGVLILCELMDKVFCVFGACSGKWILLNAVYFILLLEIYKVYDSFLQTLRNTVEENSV